MGNPVLAAIAAGTPLAECVPLPKFKQGKQVSFMQGQGGKAVPTEADNGIPVVPSTKWDSAVLGEGDTKESLLHRVPTSSHFPDGGGCGGWQGEI